jgi:hypothetical protein
MLLPDTPLDPRALVDTIWQPSDLPDRRLWTRLHKVVALLFTRFDDPTATQPRALRRGLQRFCDNVRVNAEQLAARAQARILLSLQGLTLLVLAHDTTEVNKVGRAEPEDTGPLRSNHARGYLVHSCVAIDPIHHNLLGVIDSQAWTRPWTLRKQDHKTRAPHDKESIKWRRGIRRAVAAAQRAGVTATLVHAMDREGDVHENFTFARRCRHLVITRAAQDRAIAQGPGMLWAHLGEQPVQDRWSQTVRTEVSKAARKAAKDAGEQALARFEARVARLPAERTATLELRFATVTLTPTKKRRKPVGVEAISVRELDPPANVEPIDWMLLTTCAVETVEQAHAVLGYYEDRYGIEPFHRIWKSGLHLEREPIADLASFKRLLAVLMPTASHIAQWTYAARITPQAPAAPHVEPDVLAALKEACRFHRLPLPRRAWTIKDVVTKLAQLGGYEPRPDRVPGWIVLWRGWRELLRFITLIDYLKTRGKQPPD